jgi:hypothetical protein
MQEVKSDGATGRKCENEEMRRCERAFKKWELFIVVFDHLLTNT